MTRAEPDEPGRDAPRAPAEPTVEVARPPVPGRAVRAEVAAGELATPPVRHDEPTVTLDPASGKPPHRTLQFRTPSQVRVTVAPRERPRRRWRTWPWIAAVALALLVLGAVLLVMLLRGETVDGDVDLVGSAGAVAAGVAG